MGLANPAPGHTRAQKCVANLYLPSRPRSRLREKVASTSITSAFSQLFNSFLTKHLIASHKTS
jgi:hypothetical protein